MLNGVSWLSGHSKHIRHFLFIRMLYCPLRLPPKASKWLLRNNINPLRETEFVNIDNRFFACSSNSWNSFTRRPSAKRAVRLSRYKPFLESIFCFFSLFSVNSSLVSSIAEYTRYVKRSHILETNYL